MRTLITGGSSGLGFGISVRYAERGAELLWVSHREDELADASAQLASSHPGTKVHTFAQDLSMPDAAERVHAWAADIGPVDVLVNNAGFGLHGPVHAIPEEADLKMIGLNVEALYSMTRRFLDDMRARNAGTIINVSSNSSFQPVPTMAVYAATKGFVTQFSRALAEELRVEGSNVRVITLCPAAISDTPFRVVNDMESLRTFDGLAATTVGEVVGDLFRAIDGRRSFVVSGWRQRLLMRLRPWLPESTVMAIVRWEARRR